MKGMKKILQLICLGAVSLIILAWGSYADAAGTGTVSVTVRIKSLSVNLPGATAWSLGDIDTSTVSISPAITVENNGNVNETFTLQITDDGSWTAATTANGAGSEIFVMSGIFTQTGISTPADANFNTGTNDDVILSSSAKTASVTDFANSTFSIPNGLSVPAAEQRTLWLQFKAPTSTAVTTLQTIQITVGVTP